jgi:hypothetical protein
MLIKKFTLDGQDVNVTVEFEHKNNGITVAHITAQASGGESYSSIHTFQPAPGITQASMQASLDTARERIAHHAAWMANRHKFVEGLT